MNHPHLVRELHTINNIERSIIDCRSFFNITCFKSEKANSKGHLLASANGCQLHINTHLSQSRTPHRQAHHYIIIVIIARIRIFLFKQICKNLQLVIIRQFPVFYDGIREVYHILFSGVKHHNRISLLAVNSSRIKRLLQIRIGDGYRKHRLTRYITFAYDRSQISYCWVFRQDLNMLNILQPTNIHHQCLRRTQLPIVIFIHILNWRHLINNLVVALKIKLIANTTRNHQHPTEETPYQPLIILHTFSLLK